MLLLQVYLILLIVAPEVVIDASQVTVITSMDEVIINCSVLRGNPSNYSYSINHIDTGNITLGSFLFLPDIQEAELGTYRCDVTNEAGTGNASVTIRKGGKYLIISLLII